jgi:hypothetical protein
MLAQRVRTQTIGHKQLLQEYYLNGTGGATTLVSVVGNILGDIEQIKVILRLRLDTI